MQNQKAVKHPEKSIQVTHIIFFVLNVAGVGNRLTGDSQLRYLGHLLLVEEENTHKKEMNTF